MYDGKFITADELGNINWDTRGRFCWGHKGTFLLGTQGDVFVVSSIFTG